MLSGMDAKGTKEQQEAKTDDLTCDETRHDHQLTITMMYIPIENKDTGGTSIAQGVLGSNHNVVKVTKA